MRNNGRSLDLIPLLGMRTAMFVAAMAVAVVGQANAQINSIPLTQFSGATLEQFRGPRSFTKSYDFGNGLTHLNLSDDYDIINNTSGFALGTEPEITSGKDDAGYFTTNYPQTTFQFAFAGGVQKLGFWGAEANAPGTPYSTNGELDIEFYDMSNSLIDALSVSTLGTFAWDQFHGFSSSTLVSRVVFREVGHMVLDDLYFDAVPEPSTMCLLGLGGVLLRRRKLKSAFVSSTPRL